MKITIRGKTRHLLKEKIEVYSLFGSAFSYYTEKIIKQKRGISPDEFVRAIGSYAVHEYGLLAATVLKELSLNSAKNIGAVIYELVSINGFSLEPNEEISDFSAPALEEKYRKFLEGKLSITIQ